MKRFFVLERRNTSHFMGRIYGRWTMVRDLEGAAQFATSAEADSALQALWDEAKERCHKAHETWPREMWWSVHGGATVVREVEVVMQLVPEPPLAPRDDVYVGRAEP